jgi:hypothetical protein
VRVDRKQAAIRIRKLGLGGIALVLLGTLVMVANVNRWIPHLYWIFLVGALISITGLVLMGVTSRKMIQRQNELRLR